MADAKHDVQLVLPLVRRSPFHGHRWTLAERRKFKKLLADSNGDRDALLAEMRKMRPTSTIGTVENFIARHARRYLTRTPSRRTAESVEAASAGSSAVATVVVRLGQSEVTLQTTEARARALVVELLR